MIIWVIFAIFIIVVILALLFVWGVRSGGIKKRPTDYRTLFIIGICWVPLGIPLKNYAFTLMGLVFMVIGLAHHKEWDKNVVRWKDLTEKEKKFKILLIWVLLIGVLVGVAAFFVSLGLR